ncbi:MAG TPA: hypothetical protein VHG28_06055 [Longimicrobiaceae bacterium]|nr:hypothetical protein [Longimicrobiaceae bacterium]
MSHSLSDYFALEAGEFLEQLDALLSDGGTPDAEHFFRLARGVRGSARVAREEEIAEVAEGMEAAARALVEHTLPWSEELRARAIRTVDDLKILVRYHGRWGPAERARAREAAARWKGVQAERTRPAGPAGDQLVTFLRREVMGVVSELDHTIGGLRRAPGEREPLRELVRRMRPLRGMAGMDPLAPIQEVLEGVEDSINELLGQSLSLTDAHLELFGSARGALLAALQTVERGGGAGPLRELERFREVRDRVADAEGGEAEEEGVVPINALFYDDAGPHVVSSPLAPAPEAGETPVAEVERFLRLEATGFLDRAEALIADLDPRRERRFGRVAGQLARLAQSVGDLSGAYGVTAVARTAERAATELREARSVPEARAALARLRAALPGAAAEVASPAPPATEPVPEPPTGDDVVPIESLLLRGEAALREALALRGEIERLAAGSGSSGKELNEKLTELFDLVSLGLEEPTTP